ncbi:high mobility group protein [Coniosporium tulheliwenetii]|uniref:High mobility group protein n=1 Tax=Coniosporium tulheliwenetii TaxID=3383036 RepID=A0ACC2ZGD5_9PEZI|nr:high mobility group protein [Cladosporium sp. JES 115]
MGRPKKEVKENGTPEGYVSKANFMRTRDSIVTGLTELENLVTNLRSAFVQHTSEVLSGQSAGPDTLAISNPWAMLDADVKQKKKKVKKEKDPNAPKRALTAYLLYAQHARSLIKAELGEGAKRGEVADEITKRWHEMPDGEKLMWKEAYQTNREKYKEELAEYVAKTGNAAPTEASPHDDEVPDADATAAALADDTEESSEDEDEEDEEEEVAKSPTPAPKLPTPPISQPVKTTKGRKAKAGKENGVTAELPSSAPQASQTSQASAKKSTQIPVPAATPEPAAPVKAKSPEKRKKEPSPEKRKKEAKEAKEAKESSPEEPKKKKSRKSKGGEESQSTQEAEAVPPPTSEKKPRKKRKSDAA